MADPDDGSSSRTCTSSGRSACSFPQQRQLSIAQLSLLGCSAIFAGRGDTGEAMGVATGAAAGQGTWPHWASVGGRIGPLARPHWLGPLAHLVCYDTTCLEGAKQERNAQGTQPAGVPRAQA